MNTTKWTQKGTFAGTGNRGRHVRFVALIMSSVLLSACSTLNIGKGEYACTGLPEGVQCMSTRDVYALTNDGNVPVEMNGSDATEPRTATVTSSRGAAEGFGDEVVDNYVAPRLPDRPVPIRTPAQVMRIWVAPWEDKNGDLIVSGYVYTEIEPRRWVIGDGAPESEPVLRPLQTVRQESPQSEARN